jgi:hypothetical protein
MVEWTAPDGTEEAMEEGSTYGVDFAMPIVQRLQTAWAAHPPILRMRHWLA